MKKALVLFSGTGSVDAVLKAMNYEVVSVDINSKWNATYTMDVRQFISSNMYPPGYFQLIWASPDCSQYSKANTTGVRNIIGSNAIVKMCLCYMMYMKPTYWFMENPVGLLKEQQFMKRYWNQYMHTTSYCMYGKLYKKPTNIWTNKKLKEPLKYCRKTTPCILKSKLGRHIMTPQRHDDKLIGVSPDVSYQIPSKLLDSLFR